jgi:hypothetical protein
MSILRSLAGRASEARRISPASRRDPARRRARPRLESLEGRLVLAGPGATLDLSTAPYFLQERLAQRESAPDWNPMYGLSVAMTPDGDVLAVTSSIRSEGGGPAGLPRTDVVEIWERSGREWSHAATLVPPAGSTSSFIGGLLAISDDGSTVVASAQTDSPADYSLLVYERDGASWAFRQDIDAAGDRGAAGSGPGQRTGLAISGDGDVIALGTPSLWGYDPAETTGMVRVYTQAGDAWGETARLASPDPATAWSFGISVGLSADGATLAVGSAAESSRNTGPGGVYVYRSTPGGGWGTPTSIASPGFPQTLGERLAMSADGKTLLVSATEFVPDPNGEYMRGAAYIYEETDAGWESTARLVESTPSASASSYGRWFALSPDGDTAVVAGPDLYLDGGRDLYVYGRESGWGRVSVITPDGSLAATNGVFGGLVTSDDDVVARSVRPTGWTVDVYHRPTGFEVILDPSDLAASPGEPTTFLAAAAGATGVDVRWQSSADGGRTWADIPAAVHAWYTIVPTLDVSGTMFRAVFTDAHGASVTTRPATLSVARATPVITVETALATSGQRYLPTFHVRVASDGANPTSPHLGSIVIRVIPEEGAEAIFSGTVLNGLAVLTTSGREYLPGTYTIVVTYEPFLDPRYAAASITTQMVAPRFDADIRAELSVAVPRYDQVVSLIVRAEPFMTGLVTAWRGSAFLGAAVLQQEGEGTRAVIPFRFDNAGRQAIRWTYEGDVLRAPETGELTFDVARVATSIAATPRSGSPIHYFGEQALYNVVATTADGRPAPGWITVSIDGRPEETTSHLIPADGRVVITLPADLTAQGHVLRVRYEGTNDFIPSESVTGFGVYKAPTTLALTTLAPFSPPGAAVTFVARAANVRGTVTPTTGVVRFYVDGAVAAEAPLGADGTAMYTTTALANGTHDVVAIFPETENFQGSASNALVQHVGRLATATALESTRNPSTTGEFLHFVATVAREPSTGYPLTGSVRFYLGLNPIAEVPVDANGRAALLARFDASASYRITAVYLGNNYYDTSQTITLDQVVVSASPVPQVTTAQAPPATSPTTPAVSPSAVAAEVARENLTPAQARRAALAERLARRRAAFAGRMRG